VILGEKGFFPKLNRRSAGESGGLHDALWRKMRGLRSGRKAVVQQPRQIDPIILSTLASSRSMAGPVPSSGPFMGLPAPDDDSAVPSEFVPGVAALVPRAPPVTDI
jgi:hypothetical protein